MFEGEVAMTAMKMIVFGCGVLLSVVATSAGAQQNDHATVEVQKAWARATTGAVGAAYFSLVNKGGAPDRLIALKTPVAEKAELHEEKMKNGVMEMRPVGPLLIEPGQSATLKPGARHVMLMGLKHPLKEGEDFPLTLSFEKAGDVRVMVPVQKAGAMGADAAGKDAMPHMHDMDHGSMK
jgi:periplasmic copper chaperone A